MDMFRASTALLSAFALGACATPARRQGQGLPSDPGGDGASVGRTTITRPDGPGPDVPDPTEPYREQIKRAPTAEARRQVTREAVDAALRADRSAEAVAWLIEARGFESDPQRRAALEKEAMDLIDGRVSPIGLRRLLEKVRAREFPHEALAMKLGLVLAHAGERAGARSALESYLKDYPSGVYAARATAALEDLNPDTVSPTTVGVILPLSGPRAAYGRLARQALELALEGSGVRAVVRDTKGNEAHAAEAVQALIEEEGAIALLGPVFRSESHAAAVMAQRHGVPILTISADDAVSAIGPWVFRNGVTNQAQAKAVVAHAMDILGLKSFAILHPRHPYGTELRDLFWDEVTARGGEIRGVEAYDVSATTFSQEVKHLVGRADPERRPDYRYALRECEAQPDPYRKSRCRDQAKKNLKPLVDFDGLFIPDYARSIRMIAAALAAEDIIVEQDPRRLRTIERTLGRTPKIVTLLGASGWNSSKITDSTGRTVENAIFTDGFFAGADDERTSRFVRAYRERFDRVPSLYPEALIYDSARILRSVIETQRPSTRDALREALRAVVGFPGVTGKTSFAGGGDAQKELKILKVEDGAIVEVPKPDALPAGMKGPTGQRSGGTSPGTAAP